MNRLRLWSLMFAIVLNIPIIRIIWLHLVWFEIGIETLIAVAITVKLFNTVILVFIVFIGMGFIFLYNKFWMLWYGRNRQIKCVRMMSIVFFRFWIWFVEIFWPIGICGHAFFASFTIYITLETHLIIFHGFFMATPRPILFREFCILAISAVVRMIGQILKWMLFCNIRHQTFAVCTVYIAWWSKFLRSCRWTTIFIVLWGWWLRR